jgi:hypothetical protein
MLHTQKKQLPTGHKRKIPIAFRITAGRILINYPGKLTKQTANITTAKLHWNSILGKLKAKYICLNIPNVYLTATLDGYK